ncbi:hypothetical protein D3C87_1407070 [compost metagenome]
MGDSYPVLVLAVAIFGITPFTHEHVIAMASLDQLFPVRERLSDRLLDAEFLQLPIQDHGVEIPGRLLLETHQVAVLSAVVEVIDERFGDRKHQPVNGVDDAVRLNASPDLPFYSLLL